MSNGEVTKSYLYGEPKNKRSSKFGMPGCAVYSKEEKTLAMLMVTNNDGEKKTHVAWVKF